MIMKLAVNGPFVLGLLLLSAGPSMALPPEMALDGPMSKSAEPDMIKGDRIQYKHAQIKAVFVRRLPRRSILRSPRLVEACCVRSKSLAA